MTTINDPLVGTTYDRRYRIERRIGNGGMANVYLAEDETLGRRVAIKVLHQRYAEDSQFVERFLREASAAARLNHPNIVQVYDRGHCDNTYYIAMEYVDGMTLKDLVQRRNGLTEQEVLAYARQGLHALRFAHRNGIVHRDIKPHNMMVDTDGRLKIADFGIARAGADSGLTEAGSIVGTAQYLSPEQAQGHDVSATSDLYSLGVVMFEMATGRVPFDGDSPVNVALKHVKDPVPTPSSLKPGISQPLESIILKAMEKDPARRYASADEMLADLDRAREGSATQAMTQVLGGLGSQATQVTPLVPGPGATQVTPVTARPVSPRRYDTPVVAPEPAWADDDEVPGNGGPWRWLIPVIIALLLAGAIIYYFALASKGDPVPDVTGQRLAAAKADIVADGFKVGDITPEASDSAAKGLIIDQDPSDGDKAKKGSKIDLTVSTGPATKALPDVKGDAQADALQELTQAGFKPTAKSEPSEDVDKDTVIRTDPPGNTKLAPGSPVTVFVSSGPEAQVAPSVVGLSIDAARAKLGDFEVHETSVDSEKREGTVVAQDPEADQEITKGDPINLSVASGSNKLPDVHDLSQSDAQARLEGAGFTAHFSDKDVDDPTQDGKVVGMNPGSGQRAQLGTTIDVEIGRAPEQTTPDDGNGTAVDSDGDGQPDAVVPGEATDPAAPVVTKHEKHPKH
ncbi:MAG: serine/threonine protein kinase [Thermoleophilia bacterium]|nr:serine/threonine protein kinase [Thermoleophilia bacterium]